MTDTEHEVPDGWVREDVVAGMDTIGYSAFDDDLGMSGGFKCGSCNHFIPLKAVEKPTCPSCGRGGMIGTVIMGRQEVTAMYPEGWFDE